MLSQGFQTYRIPAYHVNFSIFPIYIYLIQSNRKVNKCKLFNFPNNLTARRSFVGSTTGGQTRRDHIRFDFNLHEIPVDHRILKFASLYFLLNPNTFYETFSFLWQKDRLADLLTIFWLSGTSQLYSSLSFLS